MEEPQTEQNLFSHFLSVVATQHGNLFSHLMVLLQQATVFVRLVVGTVGYFLCHASLALLEQIDLFESCQGFFHHSAHTVGDHLLGEIAYRLTRGDDDGARLRLLAVTENFEQCRLAGAILADQADAVVVIDVEGDMVEKVGAGKLDRKVIDSYHGCW